jgi:hypothetical protein
LRTLGVVGIDQEVSDVEMRAFANVFPMPISISILAAIAALLGHSLSAHVLDGEPAAASVGV